MRGHLRAFERDASHVRNGTYAGDASRGTFAGLCADWAEGDDTLVLIANAFKGDTAARPAVGAVELSGSNASARWMRRLGYKSDLDVQAYFDCTDRKDRCRGQRFICGHHFCARLRPVAQREFVGAALQFSNQIKGQVRGLETWGSWQPTPSWRLDAGLLWMDNDLRLKPGSTDPTGPSNLGNDPSLQWSLRSSHSPWR